MLKSILNLINEFALKPAGFISGVLFVISFFLIFFKYKNISLAILKSVLGAFLSFLAITLLIVFTIRTNDPKWSILIYPLIFNVWYFIFRKFRYSVVIANLFLIVAFLTNYYIVEKIFFE